MLRNLATSAIQRRSLEPIHAAGDVIDGDVMGDVRIPLKCDPLPPHCGRRQLSIGSSSENNVRHRGNGAW